MSKLVPRSVFQMHAMTCRNSSRYALDGVKFEFAGDEPIAVAADGRRMMAASWQEDDHRSYPDVPGFNPFAEVEAVIVPASVCKQVIAVPEATGKPHTLSGVRNVRMGKDVSAERVVIALAGRKHNTLLDVSPLTGRFPHYRDLFAEARERAENAISVSLTVGLWEEMLATFRAMGVEWVVLTVANPETAITLTGQTEDGVSVAGLLTPRGPEVHDKDRDVPTIGWTPPMDE